MTYLGRVRSARLIEEEWWAGEDGDEVDNRVCLLRGRALNAFCELEHALASVVASCLGTDEALMEALFLRLSAPARSHTLADVVRRKHGETYGCFWQSYLLELRYLGARRNAVVHWKMRRSIRMREGWPEPIGVLVPRNRCGGDRSLGVVSEVELKIFTDKCRELTELAQMFVKLTSGELDDEEAARWEETFGQPMGVQNGGNR